MQIYESLTRPRAALLKKFKDDGRRIASAYTYDGKLRLKVKEQPSEPRVQANGRRERYEGPTIRPIISINKIDEMFKYLMPLGWTQAEIFEIFNEITKLSLGP